MNYFSVLNQCENRITIERSKFIATAKEVKNEDEARAFIDEIKKVNSLATHNCYAYITNRGDYSRYSDDGEPQGTAGQPILEAIKQIGLTDTAVVVTRYFGGIKLGTGGLVRAYSSCALQLLRQCQKVEYIMCNLYEFSLDYDEFSLFSPFISSFERASITVEYLDKVKVKLVVDRDLSDKILNQITNKFCGKVVPKFVYSDYFKRELK